MVGVALLFHTHSAIAQAAISSDNIRQPNSNWPPTAMTLAIRRSTWHPHDIKWARERTIGRASYTGAIVFIGAPR